MNKILKKFITTVSAASMIATLTSAIPASATYAKYPLTQNVNGYFIISFIQSIKSGKSLSLTKQELLY